MGKLKRKQRLLADQTFGSSMCPPQPQSSSSPVRRQQSHQIQHNPNPNRVFQHQLPHHSHYSSSSTSTPPKSLSPVSFASPNSVSSSSSISASSSPPSTSSPLSTSPSPSNSNHHWPLHHQPQLVSSSQHLMNSVSSSSSYTLLDEDSGLGSSDLGSAYSPLLKVARFQSVNSPTSTSCFISSASSIVSPSSSASSTASSSSSTSPSSSSYLTSAQTTRHDMLNVKTPFTKRSHSALLPSSSGSVTGSANQHHLLDQSLHHHSHQQNLHHHQLSHQQQHQLSHNHYLSSPLGYSSSASMHALNSSPVSSGTTFIGSLGLQSTGPGSTLRSNSISSPNRPNLLMPPQRKHSGGGGSGSIASSMGSAAGGSQNIGQNNSNAVNSKNASPGSYSARSKNGKYELKILSQPEEQHRARYLTEGSRGAIKDKSGHGYPVVKLCGYSRQPVKIQCFIGHDKQIGTPHLFYQASKIAGKNSTACFLKKIDGTSFITMEAQPSNNMEINVDCIGILKERNVDVEQKLNKFQRLGASLGVPEAEVQSVANIKRSTRCRLVFRCEIPELEETLQAVSAPILCTQPLGTPEINKKSLSQCDINGNGTELFIIGKNFLKDAKVIFRNEKWIKIVEPNREYLKSTHLICTVPAYDAPVSKGSGGHHHGHGHGKSSPSSSSPNVIEVNLMVKSGGKCSDPHKFYYTIGGGNNASSLTFGGLIDATTSQSSASSEVLCPSDVVSTYAHDSAKLLDTLMEASNHSSDFTSHFSAAYANAQAESKAAISQAAAAASAVTPAQAADMIGASLTSHIATELVAAASQAQAAANAAANGGNADSASNSALHAESTAVGNTVLAAAAVVAANEVQALSDSNQLTAANLHQTVTTAAAVAVAATEAVLADNASNAAAAAAAAANSNDGHLSSHHHHHHHHQVPTAIPGPPNQATVAVVAAQINSMIPYLTGSSTALSVAAAVKQESLAVESEMAAAAAAVAAGTSPPQQQPQPLMMAYSSPSNDGGSPGGAQMQSMMSMAPQDLSPQQQQQVAAEQQMNVMMGHQAYGSSPNDQQQQQMSRQASMETGQMSFANVQAQLQQQQQQIMDPSALKVDRLTLHDKVPLPQLSLSDISNQLSMAQPSNATTVVNMQTANNGLNSTANMVPIDSVMSEKPIIFSQEVVQQQQQQQMVVMANNGSPDGKALGMSSMLSDGGISLGTAAATTGPSSVIMSPPGYSHHLISGDSSSLPPATLPPPAVVHYGSPLKSVSEYMQQQQPVVTDLKLSSAAAAVMAQHQQQIQQQQIQQQTTTNQQQIPSPNMINPNSPEQKIVVNQQVTNHQLTANTIESFIQNMANHENQLQQQQLSVNSMLSSALTLPSNSAPTYASLIANQQQQQMSSGVIATSSITNSSGGMLGLQSTSGVSSMMMDTLPSALTTTTTNICQQQQQMPNNPNGVILTSSGHCLNLSQSNVTVTSGGSVINSNNLESVSLPGMRGIPVQFTDNVEMTSVGQQMQQQQQQQQSMVVQTSMIISSQSTAQNDVGKVVGSEVTGTVPITGQTVLGANSQIVGGQVQQQASNICTLSTMTDAELISFINPSTFE